MASTCNSSTVGLGMHAAALRVPWRPAVCTLKNSSDRLPPIKWQLRPAEGIILRSWVITACSARACCASTSALSSTFYQSTSHVSLQRHMQSTVADHDARADCSGPQPSRVLFGRGAQAKRRAQQRAFVAATSMEVVLPMIQTCVCTSALRGVNVREHRCA